MIIRYDDRAGKFEYDNELWSMDDLDHLHWIGGNRACDLPYGVTSCSGMFRGCKLGKGFYFHSFSTAVVKDMSGMFMNAELPEGCNFNLKTLNVVNMCRMFEGAKLPSDFTLGEDFNTCNVKRMDYMFRACKLPKGFSLGERFDTSNVEDMSCMFLHCEMPEGFTLGNHFNTANVKQFSHMFDGCAFPEGFILDEQFSLKSARSTSHMFYKTKVPSSFSVGSAFDPSHVPDTWSMFHSFTYGNAKVNTYTFYEAINLINEKQVYDFKKLLKVPPKELEKCKSHLDLNVIVQKYCTR